MVGQLRVGMVPLASLNPMQLIKPLAGKYPELQFSLLSLTSEQIIDGVSRNQLDLGICYLHHVDSQLFNVKRLPQREWGCCMINAIFSLPKGRRTGKRWPHYRWFSHKGMHYRESIEMSFKSKGLTPKYVLRAILPSRLSRRCRREFAAPLCRSTMVWRR
jgi:DNA-binding transcriptional LysR family regulator